MEFHWEVFDKYWTWIASGLGLTLYISIMSILFLLNIIDCQTYNYSTLYSLSHLAIDTFILHHEPQFSKIKKIFTIHHILFYIIIYLNYINYIKEDYLDTYFIAISLLGEICVLPLNVNWYLIKTNRKRTWLFKLSHNILLITYFIFRVLTYTSNLYILINIKQYTIFFISAPLVITNYLWFYKLLMLV